VKALTLYQPHATLAAIGAKKIETRSWPTSYRGPLAIHAAKKSPDEYLNLLFQEPFYSCLKGQKMWNDYVLATCELVEVRQITAAEMSPIFAGWAWGKSAWVKTAQEMAFGYYAIGRWMWFLDNIKILPEPIPAKGMQGLWEWKAPC